MQSRRAKRTTTRRAPCPKLTRRPTTYYGYDPQGNVTTLTDATGALVGSYNYDAWGTLLASSGARADDNPYRFATKEMLGGLSFFGYRFYNAGTGRWINRDPLREDGGMNLYAAMGDNPINMTDAYGLVLVEIYARSVTAPKLGDTRLWGDHIFTLVWETDSKGNKIAGQTPTIFAGYNHDANGKIDGHLYAFGGKLNSWYDDFAYYKPRQKYNNSYHFRGVIWSMTDTRKTAKQVTDRFHMVAHRINESHLYYDWTGLSNPNSNSTVATIINEGLGLDVNRNSVKDIMRLPGINSDALHDYPAIQPF